MRYLIGKFADEDFKKIEDVKKKLQEIQKKKTGKKVLCWEDFIIKVCKAYIKGADRKKLKAFERGCEDEIKKI